MRPLVLRGRAVVAAELETMLLQGLLDLLDRLLAEVRDRGELVLGLDHQVADRLDADALEAVVGPDAELELLDREVLHPVRERDICRAEAPVAGRRVRVEDVHPVEIGEDRQLANQDLGRLGDRLLGIDGAVRRHVEHQLVVVGALADACGLDVIGDAPDRREHRVDGNDADRVRAATVALRGHIAAPAADREGDLETALRREVRDLELGVQDLEVGRRLDVGGRHRALAPRRQPYLDLGRLAVEDADELLEVEDDVGHVLADAWERRELVGDALDLDGRYRGALERREQDTAQGVAERVAEAAVEGLDREPAALDDALVLALLVLELGNFEIRHGAASCHLFLSFEAELLGVELDDQRFLDRRVDLGALRPLEDLAGQPFVVGLQPRSDGGGEVGCVAHDLLGARPVLERDHVVGLDLVARDVDAAAVDREVPVADELAGLRARGGEAEPVDDVVEARLEDPEQVFARDPADPIRLFVVGAELVLEQAVVAARLLLLAQLEQVLALLDPPAAVLARRIAAALDGALLGQAALALEEELHPLAAALLAPGAAVAGH